MKKYFLQMMSPSSNVSLMRNIVFLIVAVALICAVANIFIEKDLTTMIIGMLTAAGISKGIQSFSEK
jgi:hypothetical protein